MRPHGRSAQRSGRNCYCLGSGLDKAITAPLAREGVAVAVDDIDTENGTGVTQSIIGSEADSVLQFSDVSQVMDAAGVVRITIERCNRIDILVDEHIAGIRNRLCLRMEQIKRCLAIRKTFLTMRPATDRKHIANFLEHFHTLRRA